MHTIFFQIKFNNAYVPCVFVITFVRVNNPVKRNNLKNVCWSENFFKSIRHLLFCGYWIKLKWNARVWNARLTRNKYMGIPSWAELETLSPISCQVEANEKTRNCRINYNCWPEIKLFIKSKWLGQRYCAALLLTWTIKINFYSYVLFVM